MPERLLQLDDLSNIRSPEKIAALFQKLGYNAAAQPLNIDDLHLPARSTEAIYDSYLIADQGNGELQVLLFQLHPEEWTSSNAVSSRMRAIANVIGQRATDFLLLATKDFNQLMLVNPRKNYDNNLNLKTSIRKLLIDSTNPTNYDRDRLEAIAVREQSPQELYKTHCEAFDVEKLTKSFYKGYKQIFDQVQQAVKKYNDVPYFADADRLHQFSQRLLGRIMFLYFLQKKRFLAGDYRFLTTRYKALRTEPDETDYYAQVLEPLFFETLNQDRPGLVHRWGEGQIPYLNGGLFDRDYGEGIKDAAGRETPQTITLPNSLFDPGEPESILGFFNSYNFTIAENVAGDEDVAVDPEMLGKVFENMLAAEERGQSGTFYTPRGIVQFMCTEVLSRYLADATGMSLEAIRELIELDPDAPESHLRQLLTKEQTKQLKQALNEVKVLDPAVGSGAFPLGMMQVILAVRQVIARREGVPIQRGSLAMSKLKRKIIANNLYGVDIKPEAIEIAKLRMWLSLVVDIPDVDDVEPLPNLDYKLMCGDSLISTIHGERLIPDPTKEQQLMLAVTPIQMAIQPLLELQRRYFDAQTEERHELRSQILQAEANVFRTAVNDRRQFWEGKQQDLERKIKALKGKVSKTQEKERTEIGSKLMELDSFAADVESGERSLNFFQYHLHFNDVFKDKGGFDVVIGNPPYVRQESIKELKPALQKEYDCYTGVADLYVYFYEQGFNLLKSGGHLSYITSNKYFRAGYGEKLRSFLGEKSKVEVLIDFGDSPVFEAIAYPSIILVSKSKPDNHQALVLNWEAGKTVEEFNSVYKSHSFYMPQKELGADGWRLESPAVLRLLDKLRGAGTPLGEYVNGRFYRGILTGLNEAFVVDRATRDRLIAEHESSSEVLKPFLRGRDVKRWCVDYQDLWLIFTRRGIDITNYPAIHDYLLTYKGQLTPGIKGGRKEGSYQWYEIQDNIAYYKEFKTPKILYQEIATFQAFAWDNSHAYSNNKTFLIPNANFYLLSLLNSKIVWFFLSYVASKLQGGAYAMQTPYVSQIPIPTAPEPERLAIEALVQKCLDAKGQGVEEWEAEINDRVAHLYGLTAEEMKIIRGM
ncbi:Eco57I restriction-modification methylase domain-containing protein [Anabaena sp. 4-3]|uniref:Eco57I restriction-modification methylase domain-containing protein n=1 Tax=Anabaena sp. 4-3 TaxID=1811979 RepID=UPI00082CA295|nr:TaqI-like C-terminal specificity domain-containing protein [Anabaena sp. 4-3]